MRLKYILSLLAMLMMFSGSVVANDDGEMSGGFSIVTTVDTDKRIIYMGRSSVSYDSTTVFYAKNGSPAEIKDVKEGLVISYDYDKSKRFFLRPTATKIWIRSLHPLR